MGLELYGEIEELLIEESEGVRLWDLYLHKLQELGVKKVLDIGCGGGYFCQLAQRAGFEITGIDLSKTQVERALKRGCDCRVGGIESVEGRFDIAVAIFDVVNYLPPSQIPHFFREVHRKADRFLFDINSRFGMEEVAVGALKREREGHYLCVESRFEEGKLITRFDLFTLRSDGLYSRRSDEVVQYYHPVDWIIANSPYDRAVVEGIELYGSGEPEKWLILMEKGGKGGNG